MTESGAHRARRSVAGGDDVRFLTGTDGRWPSNDEATKAADLP